MRRALMLSMLLFFGCSKKEENKVDQLTGTNITQASAPGESKENPLLYGQSLTIPEGWTITITGYDSDAWPAIQAENIYNTAPASGYKYIMVKVKISNASAQSPSNPWPDLNLRLVGSENVEYKSFDTSNVLPGKFPDGDLYTGGMAEGNIDFQVKQGETGLILFSRFSSDQTKWRYFKCN
ncbi:MAG: hypothetical protein HY548_02950 [Elusimicrobia bacterium]|nr:hypothetical protein [Elusimicrobiota bacterium]